MLHDRADTFEPVQRSELSAPELHNRPLILAEIHAVLAPHPSGLRRWSVMRAIRKERECVGQDVPQNFEAEVERAFMRSCAVVGAKPRCAGAKDAVFFRPSERAGEVWAILRDGAENGPTTTLPK